MGGATRSPAVVIYYLMRHRSWRLSESHSWVRDRRPEIAINAEDAARLQAAELALLGPAASGFAVPVGPQPGGQQRLGQQQQQGGGGGPFGSWPAFSGGGQTAMPALSPPQPAGGVFSFGAPAPPQGQFVFGQPQQQRQQQQQQSGDMME